MIQGLDAQIIAAERHRCAAMVANDVAALDLLLDPRLRFNHATGAVDDKAAYLAKIGAGRISYVSTAWSEQCVIRLADNAAVLTGHMTTDVRVDGAEKRLNNRVMTVWSLAEGNWRLAAFQSTPLID